MPDLLNWAFRSPGRFAAVVLAALALVVALSVVSRGAGTSADQAPGEGRRAAAPTATAAPGSLPEAEPYLRTAVDFARVWAVLPSGGTTAQWRASLAPLVTPELARGLALTDPAGLPGGTPTGSPALRFLASSSALVEVPLSSGVSVLVTVVDTGGGVRKVSDVQPNQGDFGATTGAGLGGAGQDA